MLVLVEIVGVAEHHEQLDENVLRLALQFVFLCVRRCCHFVLQGRRLRIVLIGDYQKQQ